MCFCDYRTRNLTYPPCFPVNILRFSSDVSAERNFIHVRGTLWIRYCARLKNETKGTNITKGMNIYGVALSNHRVRAREPRTCIVSMHRGLVWRGKERRATREYSRWNARTESRGDFDTNAGKFTPVLRSRHIIEFRFTLWVPHPALRHRFSTDRAVDRGTMLLTDSSPISGKVTVSSMSYINPPPLLPFHLARSRFERIFSRIFPRSSSLLLADGISRSLLHACDSVTVNVSFGDCWNNFLRSARQDSLAERQVRDNRKRQHVMLRLKTGLAYWMLPRRSRTKSPENRDQNHRLLYY